MVRTSANSCSHRWMLLRKNCKIDLLNTTWCVSYEQVSTATLRVSTTFNTLPIESYNSAPVYWINLNYTASQIVTMFFHCLWQSHIDVDLSIIVTVSYMAHFCGPRPSPLIFFGPHQKYIPVTELSSLLQCAHLIEKNLVLCRHVRNIKSRAFEYPMYTKVFLQTREM